MKSNYLFLTIFGYGLLYVLINRDFFGNSPFNYYSLLLESLIDGRLDIPGNVTIDLSEFEGKWYLNWGPAAILYILVFKVVMLGYLSDKFYTLVAGILNIIVFGSLVKEYVKYFRIKVSDFSKNFLIFSFAFASPNLYLSLNGRVWFTEQIVAVLYILLSLFFLFKFLNSKNNLRFFLASVIFFNLAWFTRAPLVFHGFIYLAVIFLYRKEYLSRMIAFLIIPTVAFLAIFFSYNFFRFGNIFETGLNYHIGNPRYEEVLSQGKIFSTSHIPFNFYHFFLNFPSFSTKAPFLNINLEGNSILVFYPVLLILPLFIKKYFRILKENIIIVSFILVALFEITLILNYFATGWTQVGMRYFLDLVPIAFLATLFVLDRVPRFILILLIAYSVPLNVISALIYYSLP